MNWIITVVITVIAVILLTRKHYIDKSDEREYDQKLTALKIQYADLRQDTLAQRELINEYQEKIKILQDEYNQKVTDTIVELDEFYQVQKELKENELNDQINNKRQALEANYQKELLVQDQALKTAKNQLDAAREEYSKQVCSLQNETNFLTQRFSSLLQPLQQYEKEMQDKLFYTIQIPEEYRNDISYLLTTVAPQVQHPDIINKLIWSEYIKPYLDDLVKRANIEAKPGIYKITNIENGKAYIGKSADVKKRIAEHFKASCGIKSIADQAIHHAMCDAGLWNWLVEVIIYCDKDKLSELEKYYIEFFQTQTYGFNKNSGG